ncbi:AzlD domain-containing protein [Moraxella marmotae]|uniref:AzlD domain-containing protein n=1 Tax=Moraxella marmotae TaxID=3344520 RepID=UPI0035F30A72
MFNQANVTTLIIAVISMAILTALSRALPFLLPDNSPVIRFFTAKNSPLAPLGGAIIIAMTMVLAVPFFGTSDANSPWLASIFGIVATIIATWRGINTGMSVIIGMAGFLLGVLIVKLFG